MSFRMSRVMVVFSKEQMLNYHTAVDGLYLGVPELTASHLGLRFVRGTRSFTNLFAFYYKVLRRNNILQRVSERHNHIEQIQSVRCQDAWFSE